MPLTVEGFFLCDAAREYAGRVNALGAFVNIVRASSLPVVHAISVVARLAWPYEEVGTGHTIAVEIRFDQDDELIARVDANLPTHSPDTPDHDLPVGVNLVIPVGLHLRRVGLYSVRLIVDGTEERAVRRPLKVATDLPLP